MRECLSHFGTDEGHEIGMAFPVQSDDVLISPFAKSGTTWTQQIVHGLRTRGDMDFDEICLEIPWLEMTYDLGIDPHKVQKGKPRAFKSHLIWDKIPKGARYINVIRDPRDVLVSYYHFFEGWWFEAGSVSMREFADEMMLKIDEGCYWNHLKSWWEQIDNSQVLTLCFEDMKLDLASAIRRIAAFIHIDMDDELFEIVLRQSSIDFMQAHRHQFDEHFTRQQRDAACGLPPDGDSSKVRNGTVGEHMDKVTPDIIAELDHNWRAIIEPAFGFANYDELRAALKLKSRS